MEAGTLNCGACGALTPVGGRFCIQCGAAVLRACGSCGAAVVPGARFCLQCGASVSAAPAPPAPVGTTAERRLVSVLFADLVGFTTLSEHRDPEEVRELLTRYFERCRTLIERYGGTVEKFIGDAVMAVWGTPVAREDDAERAVRAALALTAAVTALGEEVGMPSLRVRAGVLTGNAAVDLGAEGEGMVLGDTVNTASRLQSIAAPGTVLVDDVTRRASEAAIAYEDAGVHAVKGRDRPLHAWTALRVVAGTGGARRGVGLEAPFVGRHAELDLVIDAAEESASRRAARLVTVTGDAGSGKSRLLWEFFKYVDGIEELRYWHEGRCLAYGEGVAYWALAEMIRARAGISEEDDPRSARDALSETVETFVADERERRLIEPRLAQLLGLEQRATTEPADLFSGWRLFFERMAQSAPVVLVFEDLQWADSGLLDFIDYLLEWSAEFPIYVLAIGRPELNARRPGWGPATRLQPLADDAMQSLLEGLVPGLPADVKARILERAEGVPLYAVETVRMLLDRGILTQEGNRYAVTGTVAELEVPETLHALVAARLDNLEALERTLLQDAAVLGTSFTADALSAVSRRAEGDVRVALDGLVAKQVLCHDDDRRAADQSQYRFLQALVRTIALGTLGRRERKARHLAAAEYLRAGAGEAAEIAEVLASHYLDAVAADPEAPDVEAIRALARETLAAAGRRASSLALGAEARRYFEQAAELAAGDVERAELIGEAGVAAARSGDRDDALELLGEAIEVLDAHGRAEDAAHTRAQLADVLIALNRLTEAAELIDRARASLSDEVLLAELTARRARTLFLTGDLKEAFDEADAALAIADRRRLAPVVADALLTKSVALYYARRRIEAGALMTFGLQVALDSDVTEAALRAYFNLAELAASDGRSHDARAYLDRGLALARQRGNRGWERDLIAQTVLIETVIGEWDGAMANMAALGPADDESARQAALEAPVILAARGQLAELEAWLHRPLAPSEWQELAAGEQIGRAVALAALDRVDEAGEILATAALEFARFENAQVAMYLSAVIDILLASGRPAAVEALLEPLEFTTPIVHGQVSRGHGLLLLARGDLAGAEERLREAVQMLRTVEHPFALGCALLSLAGCLEQSGRGHEAAALRGEARTLFEALGASVWVERSERDDAALATGALGGEDDIV
jgi:class 3 adenylate cyclase/tetratricopeptide (TPR) repeat protein